MMMQDSVRFMTDCDSYLPSLQSADSVSTVISSSDIFGVDGKLYGAVSDNMPRMTDNVHDGLSDNFVYGWLVLVSFVLFCYIVYSHRYNIMLLIKGIWRAKMADEYTLFFRQFTLITMLFGMIQCSVLSLKIADYFIPSLYEGICPSWLVYVMPVVLILVLMVYYLYRKFISLIIGKVVNEVAFLEQYDFFANQWGTFCTFVCMPLYFVAVFAVGTELEVIVWITIIIMGLMYAIYLIRSYRFFNSRDVSILQWFLYLCTVEFIPVSLLAFLGMRYL